MVTGRVGGGGACGGPLKVDYIIISVVVICSTYANWIGEKRDLLCVWVRVPYKFNCFDWESAVMVVVVLVWARLYHNLSL